jgi:hypothetical protein
MRTRKLVLTAVLFTMCVGSVVASEYQFDLYRVPRLYDGKARYPDFSGRDKEYSNFRTRIKQGEQQGSNFAGHYSIIQFGCGTGCSVVIMTDVETGVVYSFPLGGEENGRLELSFAPMSSLIVARWNVNFDEAGCVEEQFVWRGSYFSKLEKKDLKTDNDCWKE